VQMSMWNHKIESVPNNHYRPILTIEENRKGVLDVDTVKGCMLGMKSYPDGGCYGECYARKVAVRIGIDFKVSVSRKIIGTWQLSTLKKLMAQSASTWYRIGVFGDPCHDWDNTVFVINAMRHLHKIPVVITKHWVPLTNQHISAFKKFSVVVNTSTSGLDSDDEIKYRVSQLLRLRYEGIQSICRVVTCNFGSSQWAKECKDKQDYLLGLNPI
jgi:hypothetical protein